MFPQQRPNGLGPKELEEIKRTEQEWSGELGFREKSPSRRKLMISYLVVLAVIVGAIVYVFVH